MTWHSKDFAATNMRGQYSLAYEATVADRFIAMAIQREQINKTLTDVQRQGRIAVLAAARKMVQDIGTMHIEAFESIRGDFTNGNYDEG